MIAFSLGELKCPDLDFVYAMTWAEFQIRLFAYKRQDLYEWQKLRELMWITYIAPHQDPKKMTKSKNKFFIILGEFKFMFNFNYSAKLSLLYYLIITE